MSMNESGTRRLLLINQVTLVAVLIALGVAVYQTSLTRSQMLYEREARKPVIDVITESVFISGAFWGAGEGDKQTFDYSAYFSFANKGIHPAKDIQYTLIIYKKENRQWFYADEGAFASRLFAEDKHQVEYALTNRNEIGLQRDDDAFYIYLFDHQDAVTGIRYKNLSIRVYKHGEVWGDRDFMEASDDEIGFLQEDSELMNVLSSVGIGFGDI